MEWRIQINSFSNLQRDKIYAFKNTAQENNIKNHAVQIKLPSPGTRFIISTLAFKAYLGVKEKTIAVFYIGIFSTCIILPPFRFIGRTTFLPKCHFKGRRGIFALALSSPPIAVETIGKKPTPIPVELLLISRGTLISFLLLLFLTSLPYSFLFHPMNRMWQE